MNTTMIRMDTIRYLRSPETLVFTIAMPALLYIVFGATAQYGDYPIGHGNINMMILVNMALYGAATAAVGFTGTGTIDRLRGWGRQLAITPLPDSAAITNRVISALLITLLPLTVLFFLGQAMGADAPLTRTVLAFVAIIPLSITFALYGFAFAYLLRSEVAVTISVGFLVLLGFLGNVFTPLSGWLITIAKFTPMYGPGVIARYPITGGVRTDEAGVLHTESLLWACVSTGVWILIFGAITMYAVRRARSR
ncbi:MAG: ABC transporter permease [Actinomycetaceae bacterium]|nr:ABC transporter permease [Actinomycetaceae bacterium]